MQLLAAHRDIKSSTYARIHRSFLLHLGVQIEHAGGRQNKRIIGDSVRRTIAHAGTRPQRPPLEWRITDIHSRSHKETVPRGVIGSHTCYQRENLVVLEVILGKDTGRQLPTVQVKRRTERGKRKKIEVFSVLIEVKGDTGTQAMIVIHLSTSLKITLIEGVEVGVQLVGLPSTDAVAVIEVMIADRSDDRYRRTTLRIEDIAVLHESLNPPGIEVDMVRIIDGIGHLSTSAAVIKPAHKGLKSVITVLVEPSVGEVRILHLRHVRKTIFILVHRHESTGVMG